MAGKKSKNTFLNKELDPTTESLALGSAFSVLFLLLLKSLVIAIPVGLALALAHFYGRTRGKKGKRSRQK